MKLKKNRAGLDARGQKLINDLTRKFMGSDVALRLLPNNGIMINGLETTIVGESIGKASSKGFVLSFSGDEIDKNRLRFTTVTLTAGVGDKKRIVTKKLERTKKSDGKYVCSAKFSGIYIPEAPSQSKQERLESIIAGTQNQFVFRLTPSYEGEKECEVMITLYPYESVLTGASTLYKKVTSNSNYYADSLKK